jgi:hypothetical protein
MTSFFCAGALLSLVACSSSPLGAPAHDAGALEEDDAGESPIDAGADAGTDAGAPDAGPPDGRCFDDVEIVRLQGGREFIEPLGLFAHEGGWVAVVDASSHGDTHSRFATFLDRDGRITGTQGLGWDYFAGGVVLGRFILTAQYEAVRLYEIGENELVDRSALLDPMPPTRFSAMRRDGDRIQILSAIGIDPTAGSFHFAYSEVSLDREGGVVVRTAELPGAHTLGSASLIDGLTRYHGFDVLTLDGDTLAIAFRTGDTSSLDGQVWNVVRLALDRSALERGLASWSLVDETRWEGPIAIRGLFADLGRAVGERYRAGPGGMGEWEVTIESFRGPELSTHILAPRPDRPGAVFIADPIRRGDVFGLSTYDRFRVFSFEGFEERASAPIELEYTALAWGEDQVLELGGIRSTDGLVGVLRCHELLPSR